MEAHSCPHCENIVLDLTDADSYQTSIEKTLAFETGFVKLAARDKCLFFYWALALDEDDIPEDEIDAFLDAHIANLPGVVYEGEESDEQEEEFDSGGEGEEEDDTVEDGDGKRYDAANDSNGERSGTDEEDIVSSDDTDSDRDTGSGTSSEEVLDASPREVPIQLAFHLEFSSIGPKRCAVTRDMASSDAPKRPSIYWAGPEMELAVTKDNNLADRVDTRPIVTEPASAESFALARSWLATCLDEHCHTLTHASSMPARLLEVTPAGDGTTKVCIVSTEGTGHVAYLTLSYCWGDDQSSKTTQQSLAASKGEVDIATLPRTLADAITVTIQLGYSYLWVDSLCIIQDDVSDKMNEIAKMPGIYSNAVCSIAALFPTNCKAGFLRDRSAYTKIAMRLQAQKTIYDEEKGSHSAMGDPYPVLADLIDPDDSLAIEALSQRGWCLQERLLSTRVLEYRRNQVRFLCPSTGNHDRTKADGWVIDWPSDNGGDISFPYENDVFAPATLHGWEIQTITDFRRLWYSIVEAYTQRHLTFSADRSLAISGIAQQLHSMSKARPHDGFTAGHWRSEFPQSLLWYWRYPDWTTNQRATRRRPTWAWTSVDTEVEYPQLFHEYKEQAAEIVALDVKLRDDKAPYGDVDEATLTLKGRVTNNAYIRITGLDYFPRELMLHNRITGEELGGPWLDAMTGPENEEYSQDVILLLIGTVNWTGRKFAEAAGLVLYEEPRRDGMRTFSRIGAWTVGESLENEGEQSGMMRLFEECGLETIQLV